MPNHMSDVKFFACLILSLPFEFPVEGLQGIVSTCRWASVYTVIKHETQSVECSTLAIPYLTCLGDLASLSKSF